MGTSLGAYELKVLECYLKLLRSVFFITITECLLGIILLIYFSCPIYFSCLGLYWVFPDIPRWLCIYK